MDLDAPIRNLMISAQPAGHQYKHGSLVTLTCDLNLFIFHVSDAPTSNLMISAQPAGYQYNDGTAVTLTCQLSGGNPVATLSWRCPGKSVSGSNQSTTSLAVSVLSLTMDSTYNGQQCTCTASHRITSFSRTKTETLTVYCKYETMYSPLVCRVRECPPWCCIVGTTVTSVLLYFTLYSVT